MDQALREKMKERSYRQVTKFSWEKSVRRIMDVYGEVLNTKDHEDSTSQPADAGKKTSAGVA